MERQIETEVRKATLDLWSAAEQVDLARERPGAGGAGIVPGKQRFRAGVAGSVETTSAQGRVIAARTGSSRPGRPRVRPDQRLSRAGRAGRGEIGGGGCSPADEQGGTHLPRNDERNTSHGYTRRMQERDTAAEDPQRRGGAAGPSGHWSRSCSCRPVWGGQKYLYCRTHVSTDNAQVDGHITPIAPKVQAFVDPVLVDDNQPVHYGDTLVILDRPRLAAQAWPRPRPTSRPPGARSAPADGRDRRRRSWRAARSAAGGATPRCSRPRRPGRKAKSDLEPVQRPRRPGHHIGPAAGRGPGRVRWRPRPTWRPPGGSRPRRPAAGRPLRRPFAAPTRGWRGRSGGGQSPGSRWATPVITAPVAGIMARRTWKR